MHKSSAEHSSMTKIVFRSIEIVFCLAYAMEINHRNLKKSILSSGRECKFARGRRAYHEVK